MDAEHAARDILRNCVYRAPEAGDAVWAAVQSDDEYIYLVLADKADDAIRCFPIHQIRGKFDSLALCSLARVRLQLFIKLQAILCEEDGEGSIRAGGKSRVRRKLLHHGDRLQPCAETFRKANRGGKCAACLRRFVIGHSNVFEHLPSQSAG